MVRAGGSAFALAWRGGLPSPLLSIQNCVGLCCIHGREVWGAHRDKPPRRGFDSALLGIIVFARLWGFDLFSMADQSVGANMTRMALDVGFTIFVAYVGWGLNAGPLDSPLNFDAEADRDKTELGVGRRVWPNVVWFAVLTALTALLGFVLATLLFFVSFLRIKARASWPRTSSGRYAAQSEWKKSRRSTSGSAAA